ncbi:hypothetical protein GH714_019139 [Hevea brasiliensis]|uniref:Reverse transcriptase/retrotransposon-derived protein RNase H-like domain-containing protein n=1 Tax=Hevea brasiliensis TaxID=3981 RepID=A0A6A6MTX9_HEVBR|nr:hypothetical protein GH714_019139 [Hevea brasiliensis]
MGTTTELDEAHFSCLELPLYSIGGIQQPRTMKFQGSIAGHLIVVMVDSSAGHNFISTQLQLLNLSISATPTFNVKLGDGCKISSTAMLWPVESDSEITKAGDELDDEQKVKGVAMDPAKVSSILRWPTPKTVKVVRGFLGLTGYYRRFILNHGQLARPLTTLLKKENQGLPRSYGVDCILVVVDRLSKFGHFIPLHHPYTAKSFAEIFTKEVVKLHGIPRTLAQVLLLLLTQDHSKFILEGGRKRQGVYYTAANRQGEYYTAGNGRWREISRKEHVAESSYSNGRKTEYKGLRIEQKDLERTG